MKVLDYYVQLEGWVKTQESESELTMDNLAYCLSQLRKTVLELDAPEVKTLVHSYLLHFQNKLVSIESPGALALRTMTQVIEKSKRNIEVLAKDQDESQLVFQGSSYQKKQVD